MELFVDMAHVGVHRTGADVALFGDHLVAVALDQLFQDVLFARCEIEVGWFRKGALVRAERQHLFGDRGCHGGTPLGHFHDAFDQLGGCGLLQEITIGTGEDGGEDLVVVLEHGLHQDLHRVVRFPDQAYPFDPVHVRHVDVHQHHIGFARFDVLHHLPAIRKGPCAFHSIGGIDHQPQPIAAAGVVIEYGHMDHDATKLGPRMHAVHHRI